MSYEYEQRLNYLVDKLRAAEAERDSLQELLSHASDERRNAERERDEWKRVAEELGATVLPNRAA